MMADPSHEMKLKPVGIVRSPIKDREDMPIWGVNAQIDIFEEYEEALAGIDGNTHLILCCWLHEADRKVLKAVPRKISTSLPEQGVFSLRSPSRPNPISVTMVKLLRRYGRHLFVSGADAIDGTPVVDIKPYQAGMDCVFSAKNPDRTQKIRRMLPAEYKESLIHEGYNFHGERCIGLALAVRMAMVANLMLGCDLRSDDVCIVIGKNHCVSDSLIGITGARLGNGRLLYNLRPKLKQSSVDSYSIFSQDKTIVFRFKKFMKDFDGVIECDVNDIFDIEVI
ncbi:tRNA (N6-threonylcarbamoyladenosine(37)-N6)-methyltransferase TrmO [Methanocella conradii]|uniref:tRNA (N6-threonylcarbamoyladenosine(37)-N6)-methyltransferase TrmO n=1 Tax=Methanocella conradii TaxID=1175444 RepID=UPI00157BCC54|nr:tRNA (N6-threonylcarbamoyladenosine(37)-N6)-methyltransferase TrmO [Methanocella conradii]